MIPYLTSLSMPGVAGVRGKTEKGRGKDKGKATKNKGGVFLISFLFFHDTTTPSEFYSSTKHFTSLACDSSLDPPPFIWYGQEWIDGSLRGHVPVSSYVYFLFLFQLSSYTASLLEMRVKEGVYHQFRFFCRFGILSSGLSLWRA